MEIEGPLRIGVVETQGNAGWDLQIEFRDEFQKLSLEQQGAEFRSYLTKLAMDIHALEETDRNRQGMMLVQQLVEQLLPHVESGDLALGETINVQIARSAAAVSLNDLINSGIS